MKLATRINSYLPKFDNDLEKVFVEFNRLGLTHVDLNYPEHVGDIEFQQMNKLLNANDLKANGYIPLHSVGHGVGLDIHEKPFFSITYDQQLKENMVVTVEPGVYKTGQFGIRIEDTVLIGKMNMTILTKSSKEPTIINV